MSGPPVEGMALRALRASDRASWPCGPPGRGTDGVASAAGAALVTVLLSMSLLMGLSAALVAIVLDEILLAAHHRDAAQARYAAEAGLERVLTDLAALPDWNLALSGAVRSRFTDGPPSGPRRIGGGRILDLETATALVSCGRPQGCTDPQLDAVTETRPFGSNNPRWRLYAYGPLTAFLPAGDAVTFAAPALYVTVWVGDDGAEDDGVPLQDAAMPGHPGHGVLEVLAQAHGSSGLRHAVQAAIRQRPGPVPRLLVWYPSG